METNNLKSNLKGDHNENAKIKSNNFIYFYPNCYTWLKVEYKNKWN